MSESSNDRVGQKISNYQLLRLIGHGGFADVYLGEHIYLKTLAAVKVLHARTDDAEQSDILNEARAIARLEHPNIIRLFEYGVEDGYPFLIMSYAARGSLRNYYPKGSRLPAARVVSYVQQAASALGYAHKNRLIHRDVKPENMLIGQNEQLLLTDFGLVMMAQTSRSQSSGDLAGTVAYMAPEQLRGRPRFASDQYALGVVVYEWLCGKRPFNGSFAEVASQQVMESPPSLCEMEPDLPSEVEQVVLKALAKNPADRFEGVGEFARALCEAYGSPSQFTRQLAWPPTASPGSLSPNVSSISNQSVATLSSSRADSGETVEIPIDEAITSIYDGADSLDTAQMINRERPDEQIGVLPNSAETVTPDTALQTFQLSPVINAAQTVPARHAKVLKSIPILIALLLLVGGSITVGFNKFADEQGTQISTRPRSTIASPVTTNATNEATSTTTAVRPTHTPNVSKPTPDPAAPKPSLIQKILPVLTPTSVPPTRAAVPTSALPVPTPTPPVQDTPAPVPTPDPNATPTPALNTTPTPDPNIIVPTPDTNLIPGLSQ